MIEFDILRMLQFICHYGGHLIVPSLIAMIFYGDRWKKVGFFMTSTILVDLDHLAANPIFDPTRCSIGYHFLHTYWAIAFYVGLLFFRKIRIIGIGLVLHMIIDTLDCMWNFHLA